MAFRRRHLEATASKPRRRGPMDASPLFVVAGAIYLILAVFYNELLAAIIDPDPPLEAVTVAAMRKTQLRFLFTGIALIGLAEFIRPRAVTRVLQRCFARPRIVKLTAFALVLCLPVYTLELCLRPFARLGHKTTSIFEKDPELGWKLRPGAVGLWGEVTVAVNDKGLRGPEVEYDKPPGTVRILHLGDSVTFGYRLDSYEQTFPHLIGRLLQEELSVTIETINAAVGGYSPWQEHAWLKREGLRYDPDLVIVSFVLNDVTEKMSLRRFGGTGEGHHLSQSYYSLRDWLRHHSGIVYFADRLYARLRFGPDVRRGAAESEFLDVRSLVDDPDDARIREAWRITLDNLGALFDLCREHAIPAVLVAHPFTFQFDNPDALSGPQQILRDRAAANGVHYLDLLPALARIMAEQQLTSGDLYLDRDHLSPRGCRGGSDVIVRYVLASTQRLLPEAATAGRRE